MKRDSFVNYPIRTSKGGGTKCTTCEKRTNCHECCTCVYPYICVDYNLYCDGTPSNIDQYMHAIEWDCLNNKYDLSYDCNGYPIDIILEYKNISGVCYGQLSSEFMGLTGVYSPRQIFSSGSNCRCPFWDFNLGSYGTISTSPYKLVSIGHQRCIDKGPDDCTAGRCLPKELCAKFFSAAYPTGVFTTLDWYHDDSINIDCCCKTNVMPSSLVARFLNYGPDCTKLSPIQETTIYGPERGKQLTDPGGLVHLIHRVATTGDFWVNNYPYINSGSHVWASTGIYNDIARIITPISSVPEIGTRMVAWCDYVTKEWNTTLELINITLANSGGAQYMNTPFSGANPYSNVYKPSGDILGCNPFYYKTSLFSEADYCYDKNTYAKGTGTLEVHIQEFVGWTGYHPLIPNTKVTVYSEVVPIAGAPQSSAADCSPKIHIQTSGINYTFKAIDDDFDAFEVWPDPVFKFGEFIIDKSGDPTTKVDIGPKPCDGCGSSVSTSGDPYYVRTACCSSSVPRTLYVHGVNINDCTCIDSVDFTLIYNDATEAWEGTSAFCTSCTVTMKLTCEGLIESPIWRLTWGFEPFPNTFLWNPSVVLDVSFSCSPFYWLTRTASNNTCCNSSMAASIFRWEITE